MREATPNPESEKREREPRQEKKVRMFLFQSRDPKSLPQESMADIAETTEMISRLDFTNMILLRKDGGSENPNQLMPIGGTVEDGESVEKAIHREVVEEAHLRTSRASTHALGTSQRYTFDHSKKGPISNEVTYFVGRLLPGDIPFSLNPEEDKIGSFESYTFSEYKELFQKGVIKKNGETYTLLDSLQKESEQRKEGVKVEQGEVDALHQEVQMEFQLIEGDKKLHVLTHLIDMHIAHTQRKKQQLEDFYTLLQNNLEQMKQSLIPAEAQLLALRRSKNSDIAERSPKVEEWYTQLILPAWQHVTTKIHASIDDIKIALHLSNTDARIRYMSDEKIDVTTGVGVPSMALFFPLVAEGMETQHLAPHQRKVLKQHVVTAELLHATQVIDAGIADGKKSDQEILHALQKENALLATDLTPEKIAQYSTILDTYFARLFDEAKIDNALPLRQQAAVDTPSLQEKNILTHLMQLATGSPDLMPKNPYPNNPLTQAQYEQQVRWEAARKMILIFLLAQTEKIYEEKKAAGVGPITELENTVVEKMNGTLTIIATREKTLLSLFRKMIVRDAISPEMAKDLFAETLLCNDAADTTIETRDVPTGITITNEKGEKVTQLSAPPSIHKYFQELGEAHAKKTDGTTLSIIEWKEPKESGMASNSAGGGGKIRMWKWYIEHTATDGMKRQKEVQAFAPTQVSGEDGETRIKSAQEFFEEKKGDDFRYGILRLFDTHTSRSFIELLFPSHVYAEEARQIFTNVVSNKAFSKKRNGV